MEIQRAIQIEGREWENIRVSLEGCGDIGEFDSNSYVNNRLALVLIEKENKFQTYEYLTEGSFLVRSLIEMENKLPKYGYFTSEAAYVFTILASRVAERLGLIGGLAKTFGSGYSWVRTGWFDSRGVEKHHVKQLFFFKLFFPLGGYFKWDFNSPLVKVKLRTVFNKFVSWQDNPGGYIHDVRDYREQIQPLWRSLSIALDLANKGKEYERWERVEHQF